MVRPGSEPGALPLQSAFPLAPRSEVSELTCKRSAFKYFSCAFPAVSWKPEIRSFRHICGFLRYQVKSGSAGKEFTCKVGELGSIPGLQRSPGEGKGYPLQYSGLENAMDCIVQGVAKSQT